MAPKKLTALQLELLRIYSFEPSEEDLLEIKKMLEAYFAKKLTATAQKAFSKKKMSDEDLEKWYKENS